MKNKDVLRNGVRLLIGVSLTGFCAATLASASLAEQQLLHKKTVSVILGAPTKISFFEKGSESVCIAPLGTSLVTKEAISNRDDPFKIDGFSIDVRYFEQPLLEGAPLDSGISSEIVKSLALEHRGIPICVSQSMLVSTMQLTEIMSRRDVNKVVVAPKSDERAQKHGDEMRKLSLLGNEPIRLNLKKEGCLVLDKSGRQLVDLDSIRDGDDVLIGKGSTFTSQCIR